MPPKSTKSKASKETPPVVQMQGGEIRIQIYTPNSEEESAKSIRIHEIHNETLATVKTMAEDDPASGQDSEQHAYDTSPNAQAEQSAARSNVGGGTIVIEIHNETRYIHNHILRSGPKSAKAAQMIPTEENALTKRPGRVSAPAQSVKTLKDASASAAPYNLPNGSGRKTRTSSRSPVAAAAEL